ncbi:hypothetical protein CHX27_11215 [Flavobacterium aurantiibacter]|uniref:Uncharacterized protein n=1 Tax=Flavobacterium aurantiibacter TaxID=2023067 RepID=A0A255ZPV3_9FLAO|nr:hypothetical protein CHX27_11215 [Flavobacterium aurantiibacter]
MFEPQLWWRRQKPAAVRVKTAYFLRTTAENGISCIKKLQKKPSLVGEVASFEVGVYSLRDF